MVRVQANLPTSRGALESLYLELQRDAWISTKRIPPPQLSKGSIQNVPYYLRGQHLLQVTA